MKIKVFGDSESIIMLNLAGIDGVVFEKGDSNFEEKFEKLLSDPEVGIIIITDRVFVEHQDYILPIKMRKRRPIIVPIPNILNEYAQDYISSIIKQYIGIDLTKGDNEK